MVTLALGGDSGAQIIPVITPKGNKFIDSEGFRFYLRGIAYQRLREEGDYFGDSVGYIDPLANSTSCLRDLNYLQQLNVNVVRVYQIDPSKNHDVCMNAFAAKGIYVLADLAEPSMSINRNYPSWDVDIFDRYKDVVDSMHKYNNLLGFFAGNEVSNSIANIDASPYVKASIRDIKSYIKSKNYRQIPIGYASNDDAIIRNNIFNYFTCGKDDSVKADFFGLNMYEWCGYSTYSTSGYRDRTIEFSESPVPIFFSEFGCNTMSPRPFTEVEAIYGLTMSKVWSGGIAYEYFQHQNGYGVVKEEKNGEIKPLDDFNILSSRFSMNAPKRVKEEAESLNNIRTTQCVTPKEWPASTKLPPTPDRGACECLASTFSCILAPSKGIKQQEFLTEVCSQVDCNDIQGNGLDGIYGKFSFCGLSQKVSFALNRNYLSKNKIENNCDFDKRAVLVSNNDKSDLSAIYLSDGRSCDQILKDFESPEKLIPNSLHKGITPNGQRFGHNEARNGTNIQKSSGFYLGQFLSVSNILGFIFARLVF